MGSCLKSGLSWAWCPAQSSCPKLKSGSARSLTNQGKSMTPHGGRALFSSVPPCNFHILVLNPLQSGFEGPFTSPHALLPELQKNKDTIRCVALILEVHGSSKKQPWLCACNTHSCSKQILDSKKQAEWNWVSDQTWSLAGEKSCPGIQLLAVCLPFLPTLQGTIRGRWRTGSFVTTSKSTWRLWGTRNMLICSKRWPNSTRSGDKQNSRSGN